MRSTFLLLGVILLAAPAFGDTVVAANPAAFYGGWTPSESGTQFWNQHSWDGNACAIGFYIYGNMSDGCGSIQGIPNGGPQAALPYLGDASDLDSAVTDFYFGNSSGENLTLKLELAGWAESNILGAYFLNPDGSIAGTQVLFSGPDHPEMTVLFNPQQRDFGFYIVNGNGQTLYTESSRNPQGYTDIQHFVVFREAPAAGATDLSLTRYWLGVEDIAGGLGSSDRDFNDMVFSVEAVPEPATLLLLGSALLLLGALGRRRRR